MKSILEAIRYGWRSRRAWWFTATARTQERFARTTLGSFWLGLSNLLSIAPLLAVYGSVFKVQDYQAYAIYLGTGLIIWNTLATAIQSAPNLLRTNALSLRNTNIHPIFYSMEEWAFQAQTFAQSFSLVLFVLAFLDHELILNTVTAGVLPLINILLFIYWVPLLLCLLGSHYEDIYQLLPVVVQLMFLLSPILYKKEALGSLAWIAEINLLYVLLNQLRKAVIEGNFEIGKALICLLANIVGCLAATWLLQRQRRYLPFLV